MRRGFGGKRLNVYYMKSQVKIDMKYMGGSWHESETGDTIYFRVKLEEIQGMPAGGQSISINTWDDMGERDTDIGNTHFKHTGLTFTPRPKPLAIRELIKEVLNLP
jgi:hypothetical protein